MEEKPKSTDSVEGPKPTPSVPCETADPQDQSQLFATLPGEIRNRIFSYAVTQKPMGDVPFHEDEYFYRPWFRYAQRRLDMALLCTCRRAYKETKHLPARQRKLVAWFYNALHFGNIARFGNPMPNLRGRTPRYIDHRPYDSQSDAQSSASTLHLFTQQVWLEGWHLHATALSLQVPNLRKLVITLKHSDWRYWEISSTLALDARFRGHMFSIARKPPQDGMEKGAWGEGLQVFPKLEVFELELETVEGKKEELDDVVKSAQSWILPMTNRQILQCNLAKTRRNGWIGRRFCKCSYFGSPESVLFWVVENELTLHSQRNSCS